MSRVGTHSSLVFVLISLTRLSQGRSAVRESAGCKVKSPLLASVQFISSSLANKSCYEILFFLSPSDELIRSSIKCSTKQTS